ncbi:MAG: sodium-translocating pyrophosphatase [Armatimonadota bacterium]|nr:sodium-translocating pyrophosphatase [Armatimonadota bacterium]
MENFVRRSRPALGSFLLAVGLTMGSAGASYADGKGVQLPAFTSPVYGILGFVLLTSLAALAYGFVLRAQVKRLSPGTPTMQEVGEAIRSGALAYLAKQVKAMLPLVAVLAVLLVVLYYSQYGLTLAVSVAVAFLIGVTFSYTAGYIGMGMAVIGNQRTANQALTTYKGALETAFKSGAVAGMMTVGLGLLGATIIFIIFQSDAMKVLVGFGFGGSLAALFMRVGGGIFTKSADVGADLVGKVEQSIPEDDPRNAATIADNVGDNVGDCAGMAADVFESYLVTLVAALLLGGALGTTFHLTPAETLALILFPLVIHGVGILASVCGIASLRGKEDMSLDPLVPINRGFWLTGAIATVLLAGAAFVLPGLKDGITVDGRLYGPLYFVVAPVIGVVLALVIGKQTEYFTGTDKRPVNEVAHASQTGPATLILSGFSLGLESAAWSVAVIVAALFSIVLLFGGSALLSAYGIALAGLGLLTTTGYVLAMDTFGPISDNAQGIFEMSGAAREQHAQRNGTAPNAISGDKVVSKLDSAGNTTKALTKGFAIATAVIAAVALFQGFVTDAGLTARDFSLVEPKVFIGLLIGGAAPFLFCSFAINAVSRAAFQLVEEVRRQFREIPGIMDGTGKPDYARCVSIATAAAQKELLGPGILAICLPILVGFGLGAPALGGYLAGAIVTGQLMAVLLANSGGAWDNAKKKIEDGMFGGKGTEQHKASVIGDTVGDPFKDTAGPALNPLIKVMNLVGVLIAGIVTTDMHPALRFGVVIVMAALLAGAILFSKRGGLAEMADREASGDEGAGQSQSQEQTRR